MALLQASCGDGASSLDASRSGIVEQESELNRVLLSDSPELTTKGMFESFEGYLSESRRVLRGTGGDSRATFRLPIPEPGYYEVFAAWPQTGGAGAAARITVAWSGGRATSRFDQSVYGGSWNSLGVFPFQPQEKASVTFESDGSAPILVDAVRVQYLGTERPALVVDTAELPVAEQGTPYSGRLLGSGGIPPYAWRLVGGELPPGLEFDESSGLVSGVPAFTGNRPFSIEVRDSAGSRSTSEIAIDVVEPASLPLASVPATKSRAGDIAAEKEVAAQGSSLLSIVEGMAEGEWRKVNLNSYSDVWAPAELRPLFGSGNPTPHKIIEAWSSFAWDPNRGNLILYGGGHANYRGNDVYLWRGSTRMWERASLPSEMRRDPLGNWNAIDSADAAPASAHTYDNTIYLPILDRMLVLGGAADANGGHYYRQADATTSRKTGPYLFDPSRADPWKVGGTTGSHVQRVAPHPEVVGGNMWSNREDWLNASRPPSESFVNDCTAYAQESGRDVVYVRNYHLYKYTIPNLSDSTRDTWQLVGIFWGGPGDKTSCGVDPGRTFVRIATNAVPFVYWNLRTPGSNNRDVKMTPTDPTGEFASLLASNSIRLRDCGLDFDRPRNRYALWCGDGRVWMLEAPATISPDGWTIRKQRSPIGAAPNGDVGTGILGKWKYAPDLDAFVGLQDAVQGNVWIYKPVGWQGPGGGGSPGNVAPAVTLTQPIDGSTFVSGQPLSISATASDADGSVSRVRFFSGSTAIGEDTTAPFQMVWSSPPIGTVALTAVATDNLGAETISAPVSVSFTSPPGGGAATVVLQNGLNGYAGSTDTYLSSYHPSLSFGASTALHDQYSYYPILVRFRIFQAEGGPVPDGATIDSARLALYKYSAYNMNYAAYRLLKNWREDAATWIQPLPSGSWSVAGAAGAGSDYRASADATGAAPWDPGWVEFDVTAGVQAMSMDGGAANFGWRLRGTTGSTSGIKRFYSSQYTGNAALRPRLTVSYR